jgi:hypothetical protein
VVVKVLMDTDASTGCSHLKVAASTGEKSLGALMIAAAIVYLIPFVSRAWIPQDDGMLAQAAELVLHGGIPHLDYEEVYTGGLSWLYAGVFRTAGVDLVNIRWALFVGASVGVWLIYAITRRYLRPASAGLATWIALVWSFPNYFAGLPSWWLLICALLSLWALIRYVETQQWRYVLGAGLAAGLAITIKQTGLYLFMAVLLSLLYNRKRPDISLRTAIGERVGRWALAAGSLAFAGLILAPRLFAAEGLYLLAPVLACAVALAVSCEREQCVAGGQSPLKLACVAASAAGLPVACFAIPYMSQDGFWQLVYGAVLLPRMRIALISRPMLEILTAIPLSVPLLGLAYLEFRSRNSPHSVALTVARWTAAIVLPVYALWDVKSYHIVWQFARAAAALLPVAAAWLLASGRLRDPRKRTMLFMSAVILAWISLNQFPYAGPVYFCYTAPLAVISAIAAVHGDAGVRTGTMRPWVVLLLMFPLLSANRVSFGWLGVSPDPPEEEVFSWSRIPERSNAQMELPRAHLNVSAEDANTYGRLVTSIRAHLNGGQLVAGPDCPEVYFLAGLTNPSGRLYDTFSNSANDDATPWLKAQVIVVNHVIGPSGAPSTQLITALRRAFSHGERLGQFEIRWR